METFSTTMKTIQPLYMHEYVIKLIEQAEHLNDLLSLISQLFDIEELKEILKQKMNRICEVLKSDKSSANNQQLLVSEEKIRSVYLRTCSIDQILPTSVHFYNLTQNNRVKEKKKKKKMQCANNTSKKKKKICVYVMYCEKVCVNNESVFLNINKYTVEIEDRKKRPAKSMKRKAALLIALWSIAFLGMQFVVGKSAVTKQKNVQTCNILFCNAIQGYHTNKQKKKKGNLNWFPALNQKPKFNFQSLFEVTSNGRFKRRNVLRKRRVSLRVKHKTKDMKFKEDSSEESDLGETLKETEDMEISDNYGYIDYTAILHVEPKKKRSIAKKEEEEEEEEEEKKKEKEKEKKKEGKGDEEEEKKDENANVPSYLWGSVSELREQETDDIKRSTNIFGSQERIKSMSSDRWEFELNPLLIESPIQPATGTVALFVTEDINICKRFEKHIRASYLKKRMENTSWDSGNTQWSTTRAFQYDGNVAYVEDNDAIEEAWDCPSDGVRTHAKQSEQRVDMEALRHWENALKQLCKECAPLRGDVIAGEYASVSRVIVDMAKIQYLYDHVLCVREVIEHLSRDRDEFGAYPFCECNSMTGFVVSAWIHQEQKMDDYDNGGHDHESSKLICDIAWNCVQLGDEFSRICREGMDSIRNAQKYIVFCYQIDFSKTTSNFEEASNANTCDVTNDFPMLDILRMHDKNEEKEHILSKEKQLLRWKEKMDFFFFL
ncbi:hypothetical protein RFI_02092 [Reticulomyxa filosa]|uniref:Uncharacterized protein n=1 Tax=Reticulomyxa filosa TaxID=46433 RepID=X6P9X5_RETFI|nr:hypothetical protein RFI_02092 [Reticulomyxa filosa]|eukprot:ETO34981.1 hypothetical protein RFI_02092 [Reticulomyxa filosa]